MIHISSKKTGFTLIETFVAISILMIAVLGPMTLLSEALKNSRYIKDEMTANFLAQEGVESVIADRNNKTNVLSSFDKRYDCSKFYLTSDGYGCSSSLGSTPTIFSRTVSVEPVVGDVSQYRIVSTVKRETPLNNRPAVSSSIIFDYYTAGE